MEIKDEGEKSMDWLKIALFSILDREKEDSNNYIIAKYLLENYNHLSGVSLTDISKECQLSKAAISRFCKELDLMDYIDLQMLIREQSMKAKTSISNLPNKQEKHTFLSLIEQSTVSMKKVMEDPLVDDLIKDLLDYKSVYVFGHLQASHIAYTLRNNLAMFDKFCFTSQSWIEQKKKIESATNKELIIIFSSSGDYFKRMDLNMNLLGKDKSPKIYLITFVNDMDREQNKIVKIFLGDMTQSLVSNMCMNMFANYVSYEFSHRITNK